MGLNKDLGFSPEDRKENIRRISETAKLFADSGKIVLTAFISPYLDDRDKAKALIGNDFVEIFVDTSIEECIKRDPKGLYKKAISGEIKNFTGISAPYESPIKPDILIKNMSVVNAVNKILDYVEKN
jgi:adenylylsulfate kinase